MQNFNEKTYENLSVEELVALYQDGVSEVVGIIYVRFQGLIYKIAYDYCAEKKISQMYVDDFVDIAVDCLYKALESFNIETNHHFKNYWWTYVSHNFTNEFRKISRLRNYSVDPYIIETSGYFLSENNYDSIGKDLEQFINELIKKNERKFNKQEKQFLRYFLEGFEMKEIAFFMGSNHSKVYRLRKSVLTKLNKIIKSN